MSDSTSILDTISQSQSQKEVTANALFEAGITIFGRRAAACAGLVFGLYGGRMNGTSVANTTVTATASTVGYIVIHRTTLAASISSSTTNWNDSTYGRAYKVTPGASTVPTWEDHRLGTGGILTPDSDGGRSAIAMALIFGG